MPARAGSRPDTATAEGRDRDAARPRRRPRRRDAAFDLRPFDHSAEATSKVGVDFFARFGAELVRRAQAGPGKLREAVCGSVLIFVDVESAPHAMASAAAMLRPPGLGDADYGPHAERDAWDMPRRSDGDRTRMR